MKQKIDQLFTAETATILKEHLQPCVQFTMQEGVEIGRSKFGGIPDLPVSASFPRTYTPDIQLLLQLNLDDFHPYDELGVLPDHGMFYIFGAFHQRGPDEVTAALPASKQGLFGLYTEDNPVGRQNYPPYMQKLEFKEHILSFSKTQVTLSGEDHRLEGLSLSEEEKVTLQEKINQLYETGSANHNLIAAPAQSYVNQIEESWAKFDLQVNAEQAQQPETQEKIKAQKGQYVSLLQMELPLSFFQSTKPLDANIHLNVAIHKDKLAAQDFSELTYAFHSV